MLNDLIRKTNILALELDKAAKCALPSDKLSALEREYTDVLGETLRFVSENNVPRDTVVIIEDRIVRELRKKDDEDKIRAAVVTSREAMDKARKEVDWIGRSVNSGMGAAQSRYLELKARMEDFREESARASQSEREAMLAAFMELDKEYLAAKNEYARVGTSDRAALLAKYSAAQEKLAAAEAECAENDRLMKSFSLSSPVSSVLSGSGVIAKALNGNVKETGVVAAPVILPVGETTDEREEIYAAELLPADEEVIAPYAGVPAITDEEVNRRISEAVNSILCDNERFKYILEEVRFQASLEVAKVRAEVEKLKNEAFREAQRLMEELRQLKSDAAYLRQEANRARIAASTVSRAKAAATLNAKRTMNAARKTVIAARKAIDAAQSASSRVNPYRPDGL